MGNPKKKHNWLDTIEVFIYIALLVLFLTKTTFGRNAFNDAKIFYLEKVVNAFHLENQEETLKQLLKIQEDQDNIPPSYDDSKEVDGSVTAESDPSTESNSKQNEDKQNNISELSEEELYWKKFSNHYYYEQLSPSEKRWWDAMEDYCLKAITSTEDLGEYTENFPISGTHDTSDIARMFKYSNPQFFFIEASGRAWTGSENSLQLVIFPEFSNGITRKEVASKIKEKIEWYYSQVDTDGLPEEIEHQIVIMLCEKVEYDYDTMTARDTNQSVYSTFVLDSTVCSGYAQATTLLLNGCGINCVTIYGDAMTPSGSGPHAWNYIELHNHWYLLDSTWIDQTKPNYSYYNKAAKDVTDHKNDSSLLEFLPKSDYSSSASMSDKYASPYFVVDDVTYFVTGEDDLVVTPVLVNGSTSFDFAQQKRMIEYNGKTYIVME